MLLKGFIDFLGEQRIELGREFVLGVQGGPDLLALHRALALRGGELRHLPPLPIRLRAVDTAYDASWESDYLDSEGPRYCGATGPSGYGAIGRWEPT